MAKLADDGPDRTRDGTRFAPLQTGIAVYEPGSGRIVHANEALAKLYGYDRARLASMEIEDYSANTFAYTQAEAVARLQAVAADGEPESLEWRVKRGDGELIWVNMALSPLDREAGRYVLAEVRDITEYKANGRRSSLLYRIIRHNLRNDANVIGGYADALEETTENERCASFARKVNDRAMQVGALADSVKEIERAIADDGTTRPNVRATSVVTEVLEELRATYPRADVTVSERTEMWVSADRALEHALRQAVENAIVHAEAVTPTVEIGIGKSPNTGRVAIRVADENPPISPMEIEALDEYTETTPTMHGTGVGLFVMKWCIESVGGELKIEPNHGDGNRVTFLLPPKAPPSGSIRDRSG